MIDAPEVRDNPEKQRFEIVIGDHVAVAEYRLIDHGIMFTHTEVPEALGGRGLAKMLVRAGLKSARERHLQVLPVCTFFAKYITEHPEEQDLLHPTYRKILGLEA
ncbi:MAG: GNAT family N-acetyltransferase [Caulobacterales bacterium]